MTVRALSVTPREPRISYHLGRYISPKHLLLICLTVIAANSEAFFLPRIPTVAHSRQKVRLASQSDLVMEYLRLAKEEKKRAVMEVEERYKSEIQQLQSNLRNMEQEQGDTLDGYQLKLRELQSKIQDLEADRFLFQSSIPDSSKVLQDTQEEQERQLQRIKEEHLQQIQGLHEKIHNLESALSSQRVEPSQRERELVDKVKAYHKLLSDFVVKSEQEKETAVRLAETRLMLKYEEEISKLRREGY